MKTEKNLAGLLFVILGCFLLLLLGGCAKSSMTGEVEDRDAVVEREAEPDMIGDTVGDEIDNYDLEDEMSQEDAIIEPEELGEEIDPPASDSVHVEEIETEVATNPSYGLGYRIQIFASGSLEKAEALKKKMMAETAFAAYIDYEGGLYKVRVGDFPDRDSAAGARAGLAEQYPDCWIVSATIRK